MDDAEFDRALIAAAFQVAAEQGWRRLSVATAARAGGLPLPRARERFPGRAAILVRFGRLADQGRPIAVGEPATFCLVDPDAQWTVRGAALASRAANTPYEGMRLPGAVVATVLRGRITARDGKVVA